MNTQTQYLLVCLIEECGEVIQAATKILRFGENSYDPAFPESKNGDNLDLECIQAQAIMEMLGQMGDADIGVLTEAFRQKQNRVNRYLKGLENDNRP